MDINLFNAMPVLAFVIYECSIYFYMNLIFWKQYKKIMKMMEECLKVMKNSMENSENVGFLTKYRQWFNCIDEDNMMYISVSLGGRLHIF